MIQPHHIDYWRHRKVEQATEQERLMQQAWEDVQAVGAVLKQEFGVTRIIVFGSLINDRFHPDSDIDIAAEGIPAADYFAAIAAVNRVSRRWVDLKPLESLDSHFRDRVLAEGIIIDATN